MTKRQQQPVAVLEPLKRTCASCGASRPCDRVKITPDRVRGGGRELVWGLCNDCADADALGALDAAVLADVLDLDAGDPVLGHVRVPRFCDRGAHHPDRPTPAPWGHLDATDLAEKVTAWRTARAALAGGPCSWCGVGMTPVGTVWRNWSENNRPRSMCGRCSELFGKPSAGTDAMRDVVAAMLGGLSYRNRTTYRHRLGAQLGVIFWHETGRTEPNATAWAHLDLDALRDALDDLFTAQALTRPSWWRRDRLVTW
jgi:hypothetical protein